MLFPSEYMCIQNPCRAFLQSEMCPSYLGLFFGALLGILHCPEDTILSIFF